MLSHARSEEKLEDNLEFLRCHYNFLRPHRALKFGRVTRTPAMQAGLASRRLTFRNVGDEHRAAPGALDSLPSGIRLHPVGTG